MNTLIKHRLLVIIVAAAFTLSACGGHEDNTCADAPDVSQEQINWNFQNLIDPMMKISSKQEAAQFLKAHPTYAYYFIDRTQYPTDSAATGRLLQLVKDVHVRDTLYQEVKSTYGDFSGIKTDFDQAFRYLRHYYPNTKIPNVQVVMAGISRDLVVSDSLITIGLDYFLGKGATYRPIGIPQYMLKRYAPRYVVPMTILMYSQGYNQNDPSQRTLMADMVYYGKSYYFTKALLPCTPDSLIVAYTPKEMKDINKHEDIIWANLLQNKMLYETSERLKNKFIGERPNVYEIGPNCPGRIGRWVGWQIVKKYMQEHPDMPLHELMRNTQPEKLFMQSKYKPKPQ